MVQWQYFLLVVPCGVPICPYAVPSTCDAVMSGQPGGWYMAWATGQLRILPSTNAINMLLAYVMCL